MSRFTREQIAKLPQKIQDQINAALTPEPTAARQSWTENEIAALTAYYRDPEGVFLDFVAARLGRTRAAVACKAEALGLTSSRGKHVRTPEETSRACAAQKKVSARPGVKEKRSKAVSEAFKRNGHPRGFLGGHHTDEAKAKISAGSLGTKRDPAVTLRSMKTRLANYGTLAPVTTNGTRTWKSSWRVIAGQRIFFRSRWEFNYGLYLQWLLQRGEIRSWEHEPFTFWFEAIRRGCRSYLPDFRVQLNDGTIEFHEVKGWMDPRSITKLKRMKKYHPAVVVKVFDGTWFKANSSQFSKILPGWERSR